MKSKYQSGKSVGKNQTVPISVDDPRLSPNKIGQTKARIGAEIDIVGLDGKLLVMGGTSQSGASKPYYPIPPSFPPNQTWPGDNQAPKTYPGGSGPYVIIPTNPSNVTANWSGDDLVVTFDWDPTNEYNVTITQFILEVTADGVTRRTPMNSFTPNKTQTAQSITFTKVLNKLTFGLFRTKITSVCVLVADPLNNISQTICAPSVGAYVLSLPIPVITLTAISNGYSVAYTTPTSGPFDAIDIWEIESTATTAPTVTFAADGITPTNYSRSYFASLNPANVISQNYNKRWVMARFSSEGGVYTLFCDPQTVTPTSPVSLDLTPPNEVSQIQATWVGDDISIDYKLPSQDPGSRIQIKLTAPNSLVGYFYRFPDGSGRDQTTTITKKDLFDQFGEHYSSFSGLLSSIDSADNRSSGVSFTVATRTSSLTGVTPTFTTVALSNAYSVNFTLPTGATFGEVYAKHTSWVGDPTDDTYLVYAGLSPAVIVDTDYTTVYLKLRYYDDFGNTSNYSAQGTITPLNPGEITSFENPISFGTNAVIYAGNSATSGNRVTFKTSGIFAYDSTSASPSTQIISDASTGSPTFITNQATIGGWTVSPTKIEKLAGGKYTGMESGSTYSFYAGSTTSGGHADAKFIVTPAGEVTAREITIIGNGGTGNLITAGGLFTVKNDGSFTATSADVTGKITASSGSFTGNLTIGSAGSITSGTTGQSTGNAGYVLSNEGLRFDYGTTQGITSLDGATGLFITKSASIGGWSVDSTKIQKTSISGKGNIILDSSNGYIAVSNNAISSSLAGINSPGNDIAHSVFWAGTTDPNSTSNPFRVTIGGKLYSTSAEITGTVSSVGALGTITMDGTHGYISLATASNNNISYLVPRNGNIYLTGPSTTAPWSTGKEIASSGPTNAPYFSAGSSFKDYWNNSPVKGVGIYTGDWDYFTLGTSKPFITASTTGIQLSVSPSLGLLLDGGTTATGDKLNPAIASGTPSMLFYTAKKAATNPTTGAPMYSPDTEYGAWASFTNNKIKLTADSDTFINITGTDGTADQNQVAIKATTDIGAVFDTNGIKIRIDADTFQQFANDYIKLQATSTVYQKLDSTGVKTQSTDTIWQQFTTSAIKTQSTADIWQEFTSTGIRLQSTNSVYQSFDSTSITLTSGKTTNTKNDISAYGGASQIVIDNSKVSITGIPRAGTFDMGDYRSNPYYRGAYPLGYPPRQRMLIEDPVTGEAQLGMAVYYLDTAKINVTVKPDDSMGVQGDLAVWFS